MALSEEDRRLALSRLDRSVPHSARVWNYWLGGTDNFPADREVGDRVMTMLPSIVEQARADRPFLGRAVARLAGDAGIRQFLDVGTGLPTADNTHEVAGSYLVINHASNAVYGAASDDSVAHWNRFGRPTITLRSPTAIERFFDGWTLQPPGVVSCAQWRPGTIDTDSTPVDEFGGVAVRP
jgi:hypothetical protein